MWLIIVYLWVLARVALSLCRPREIVGIAGSVGKSSTRLMMYEALLSKYQTAMLSGNSETGITLSILGLWPTDYSALDWLRMIVRAPFGILHLWGKTHVVVEMGTDDIKPPKNMQFLLTLIRPTIAIHLNATATHTEQFSRGTTSGNMDEVLRVIAQKDGHIITHSGCRAGIYNAQDVHIAAYISDFKTKNPNTKLYSFGPSGNMSLISHEATLEGTTFYINDAASTDHESLRIQIAGYALPANYWENCAAVMLAGRLAGLDDGDILSALQTKFHLPKSRGSLLAGLNNSLILDSSYNNSRAPMQMYLKLAQRLAKQHYHELIVVMGDMRELGDQAKAEHEAVARTLLEVAPSALYCVGELTRQYVMPMVTSLNATWYRNSRELGMHLKNNIPSGAIVLIKGSQNTIYLEETVAALLADEKDVSKVCRMSAGWRKIKSRYFNSSAAAKIVS